MQMNISELTPKQGNVNIIVEVVEVSEAREFKKFGKPGKVATATVKDESGEIKLSLWNEQADQGKAGDRGKITNGYVSEWQGEKQLTSGRAGTLEVVNDEEVEEEEEIDDFGKDGEADKEEE